jgi:hypothetical protein
VAVDSIVELNRFAVSTVHVRPVPHARLFALQRSSWLIFII